MSIDLWVGLIVLVLLFALEGVLPYYQGRTHRYTHGMRNLALATLSGAMGAALAPLLVFSAQFAARNGWGLCHQLDWNALLCAVLLLVLFDLWMYLWHRANHRIPLLWRFHRVHHSDPAMDSTTALRFHPGEILLSNLANCLVIILLGMSLGVLVLYKTLMVAVILFHHSNVDVPVGLDRALRAILVPPSMHRVHHSELRQETDSNYGTIFSWWDRLLRSFRLRQDPQAIRFGIGEFDSDAWQRPLRLLTLPFVPTASSTSDNRSG